MPELSIDHVHQLLLEDRAEIIEAHIASPERAQILMQNTNAIADLLQLKMHYRQKIEDEQLDWTECSIDGCEDDTEDQTN